MLPICIGKTNISFFIYGCFGYIPAAAMDAFKKYDYRKDFAYEGEN